MPAVADPAGLTTTESAFVAQAQAAGQLFIDQPYATLFRIKS